MNKSNLLHEYECHGEKYNHFRYMWEYIGEKFGLSKDIIATYKYNINCGYRCEPVKAMLNSIFNDLKLSDEEILKIFREWKPNDDQLKQLAKTLTLWPVNKLAEITSKPDDYFQTHYDVLVYMRDNEMLNGSSGTWKALNTYLDKVRYESYKLKKEYKTQVNSANNNVQPKITTQLQQQQDASKEKELHLQQEVAELRRQLNDEKKDHSKEITSLNKQMKTIQATLDTLIVELRYGAGPMQKPEFDAKKQNHKPNFF